MIKYVSTLLLLFLVSFSHAENFTIEGNSIQNIVNAKVKGENVYYISELDGSVSCYDTSGEKIWRNPTQSPAVLFEIEAADINNDGNDDLLVASGDGHIYCWGSNGKLLWKFKPEHRVRFSEIAVLKDSNKPRIYAGGNDYQLYELSAKGKLLSKTKIEGVVRKIEIGDFLEEDRNTIFVMTYAHDKYRWDFMGFIDPDSKQVLSSLDYKKNKVKIWSKFMVNDLSVADIDGDNRDDLLFFGHANSAVFKAWNGEFKEIVSFVGKAKDKQRYAHAIGTSLLPNKNQIVMQYGGISYLLNSKGEMLQTWGERHVGIIFNDLLYQADTDELICAGQVGGGNGIYTYSLQKKNWWKSKQQLQGRMTEVNGNLNKLYQQTLNFTPPVYQKPSSKEWLMITRAQMNAEVENLNGAEIKIIEQYSWKENTDRSDLVAKIGKDAIKKDRRGKYNLTREEIVNMAKEKEANNIPFAVWAGHGNDPFYLRIETLEAILEVAPNTCYGFVYAEMDNTKDPRVHHFINEYVPRLAKACRKNGKAKLYFRYKNMFWAASSHQEPWKGLFFSGKYNDILVPASEDTSSRTQDINFVGRVGMFAGNYVDDFCMRLVDDNPTSWRPLTPGGQRSVSPYLRTGVMLAAYGARTGLLFNNQYLEKPGLNILYALMKSGALPIVEREDILSIGSWHLIKDVDEKLVHSVDDHHNLLQYSEEDENAVVSLAQMHWAGTSLPDHDFSKLALGVEYRWMNYMPKMPHGMVPMAPIEMQAKFKKEKIPYFVSDCKVGYDGSTKIEAKQFGPVIKEVVEVGEEKMLIAVKGASWSVVRLDKNHVRVILVDPGYIDPQDREVEINFQHRKPVKVNDILSKEDLEVKNEKCKVIVPAGSIRLIDVTYK
ncbi:PQQ-binding-like beta-propeller repeat protein [Labilibaculum antarcticum]|uniref:Lambda-carrageenase n=1 Tax=Labilibaculum antarcticum TaxID=1717717 RepID=A0A1Y1CL87_9BACT|nr:hypothetical protein [Labilibaculum antarcticum]BAX81105.1 hypothetical protein ALGA_2793 [Labilibaculum antarcticum]